MENLLKDNKVYCPLCKKYFPESTYLASNITDMKVLWLANMVTHYRHTHITSWNKCWGHGGHNYRSGWFGDYETEKKKVNERAKRQIFRKCWRYMNYHFILVDHVLQLQNNDKKTIALANKMLAQEVLELF
ncbi:MAG: hypothetical protein IPM56_16155 [Ignavibacteriales bacterium]|nr:MAG: hypothetical protein IPM56_16155 [Ignavibacteriales bacterium]